MGWLCSDTAELSFTDCRVPARNLIGAENGGFMLIAQVFVPERSWLSRNPGTIVGAMSATATLLWAIRR